MSAQPPIVSPAESFVRRFVMLAEQGTQLQLGQYDQRFNEIADVMTPEQWQRAIDACKTGATESGATQTDLTSPGHYRKLAEYLVQLRAAQQQ